MRCGPSQRCHEGGSGGGGGGCAREDGSVDSPAPNTDPGVCVWERVSKGSNKNLVYSCNVTGKESLPNTNAHSLAQVSTKCYTCTHTLYIVIAGSTLSLTLFIY